MKRTVWIAAVLIVLVLGIGWYALRSRVRHASGGDASVSQQSGDQTKPLAPEAASTGQPPQSAQPVAQIPGPPGDTISRNPQNGMIFAGSGKYQLYRQGDITWRLDTDTGWACVLFATDAQWAKARVFEHGCATSQTVSR
jgi:hypothetical protein